MKKKNILFKFKHVYTFLSNGIYEIYNLQTKYNISLIVEDNFKKNKDFVDFLNSNKNIQVFFINPIKRNNIFSHFYFKKNIINIYKSIKPDILIQNDYIELENMYLFCLADVLDKRIIKVVLALSSSSTENTLNLIDGLREQKIKSFFKFYYLSKFILSLLNKIKATLSVLDNYIIPRMLGIKNSYLGCSAYNNIDYLPSYIPFRYFYSYQDFDHEYLKKLFLRNFKESQVNKVFFRIFSQPLDSFFQDVNRIQNSVIYFPSVVGLIEMNSNEEMKIKKWLSLIKEIYVIEKFEHIGVKFHPNILTVGSNLEKFSSILKSYFPNITFHNLTTNSTKLIASYDCIIGDVSSVLVQAGNFRNKIVISKDFDDFHGSDSMKNYSHINYLDKYIDEKNVSQLSLKKTSHSKEASNLQSKIEEFC